MDAPATDGQTERNPSDRYQAVGEQWENIVWGGTAAGANRQAARDGHPSARRADGLSQDGQLLEAGYGHGV